MRTLPDIERLLQPLERAISDVLIPSLIDRNCSETERDLLTLPVRMGGLGLINPSVSADVEYQASIRLSAPLVSKIEAQSHETPEEAEVQRLVYATRKKRMMGHICFTSMNKIIIIGYCYHHHHHHHRQSTDIIPQCQTISVM